MTKIDFQQNGADRFISLWFLAAPAAGANDIVATSSSSQILRCLGVSYTGAAQTGIPDAQGKSTSDIAAGSQISQAVTTVADNCWLVAGALMINQPISAGANTTERVETSSGGLSANDSNADQSPAGSFSLAAQNDDSVSRDMAIIVASFAPIAVATTTLDLTSKIW